MGSKTLTRVPLTKLHLHVRLKNCFPVILAASTSQCQVSIVVRKKHRANNFQAICKIHDQDQQHAFIDITLIIRGEIKVLLCFP